MLRHLFLGSVFLLPLSCQAQAGGLAQDLAEQQMGKAPDDALDVPGTALPWEKHWGDLQGCGP